MTTETQEQTTEAIAEEFVKQNTTAEIVAEMVRKEQSIQRLQENLQLSRNDVAEKVAKFDIVKAFITEHVKDDDEATVGELKDLAGELGITLTKEVEVEFTVTYKLTVECELDEEVSDNDFSVSLDYNGVGELTNEDADWSEVIIEDQD